MRVVREGGGKRQGGCWCHPCLLFVHPGHMPRLPHHRSESMMDSLVKAYQVLPSKTSQCIAEIVVATKAIFMLLPHYKRIPS